MSTSADERLVVMLEARISDFEKRMRQAEGTGTRAYGNMRRGSRSATRQMEQDMARSANSIRQSVTSVTGSVGSLGKSLAGAFLGGVAVGGMAEIVSSSRQVVAGIAQIGDEAKRAGLSAQAFQEWKFVAEANRISVDALVDGFKELSLRADEFITTGMGPAAEAFGRLGYGAEDLKKKLKDPSALMLEIMQRLEGMDKAAQIRIADEIFGGTGGEKFVQLLGQGEGALQDTINRAHETGAVLDAELIAKAQELDQRFRELQATAGNFFKNVIVGAADAALEVADLRAKLDEVFASEAEGRSTVGDDIYDALEQNRDLVDQNAETIRHLKSEFQYLSQEAINAAGGLSEAARQLEAMGYAEQAAIIRDYADGLTATAQAYASGQIEAQDFATELQRVQAEAEVAFATLQDSDGVSFAGVRGELGRLGGVVASVTQMANNLTAALARAAGTDAGSRRAAAADRKMQVEQESLDRQDAQRKATERFTEAEKGRNAATREQIALEREMGEVRKRAKVSGATLTDNQVHDFAEDAIAGEVARSASGRKAGGSRGSSGGRSRGEGKRGESKRGGDSLKGFDRDVQQIKERTDALNIEAAVLVAAAASGETYGDMMAYAGEKARLLAAAQEEGKKVTPELEAQIDKLAQAYARAGKSADDARDHIQKIQAATERGKNALENMFGSIIDGSSSAKDAFKQLLLEIMKAQAIKAFMNIPGMGAASGTIGNLLSFDGGSYTGNGPRSGGLDGKGGRLAMVHPRETITDHTKGQSVPGGGGVSFSPSTTINVQGGADQNTLAQIRRELDARDQRMRRDIPGIMHRYSLTD